MVVREIQTLFSLPDWVRPALVEAWNAKPKADSGPGGVHPYPAEPDDDLSVMETIQTYFSGEVINLRFLRTDELREIFNALCIFHPNGRKMMGNIRG